MSDIERAQKTIDLQLQESHEIVQRFLHEVASEPQINSDEEARGMVHGVVAQLLSIDPRIVVYFSDLLVGCWQRAREPEQGVGSGQSEPA